MKLIITINPAEDERGQKMVIFDFCRTDNDNDSMAVLRATARLELAISQEYAKMLSESEIVKKILSKSEDA